jgi:hypothetical protein
MAPRQTQAFKKPAQSRFPHIMKPLPRYFEDTYNPLMRDGVPIRSFQSGPFLIWDSAPKPASGKKRRQHSFEIARVLVCFTDIARVIVNANRPKMGDGYGPVEASTIVQYFTIDA